MIGFQGEQNKMPKKHIKRGWRVLDVGGGDAPHRRTDVVVEKFLDDVERHRGGRSIQPDRPLVVADVEALPFRDDTFDYVICSHVIEHVHHPDRALEELSRVGKAGYLAGPSELFELLSPYPAHKWVLAYRSGKLLLKPRSNSHLVPSRDLYGRIFWMLHQDRDWKRFALNHQNLLAVEFEWQEHILYRILDSNTPFYDYSSPTDVADLIAPTPPEDLWEQVKRWGRIYLPHERVLALNYWFNVLRRALRKLLTNLAV